MKYFLVWNMYVVCNVFLLTITPSETLSFIWSSLLVSQSIPKSLENADEFNLLGNPTLCLMHKHPNAGHNCCGCSGMGDIRMLSLQETFTQNPIRTAAILLDAKLSLLNGCRRHAKFQRGEYLAPVADWWDCYRMAPRSHLIKQLLTLEHIRFICFVLLHICRL